jgi:hypothetical protein
MIGYNGILNPLVAERALKRLVPIMSSLVNGKSAGDCERLLASREIANVGF